MGIRLNVTDIVTKDEIYGTKLYGYMDESGLPSFHYLCKLHGMEPDGLYDFLAGTVDTVFDYGNHTAVELTPEQFRLFFDLYMADYKKHSEYCGESEKEADLDELADKRFGDGWRDIYNSNNNKILEWS